MSRIAGEFCTWLRDLPGEDTKVPHLCTRNWAPMHIYHVMFIFVIITWPFIRLIFITFVTSYSTLSQGAPLYRPVAPPKAHRYLDVVYHHLLMLKVNRLGEDHLRALFDTAQSANPGNTKLAEGLR